MIRATDPQNEGFILPTVLLVGLAMMAIGLALIQTSSSVRTSTGNQYYNQLAGEAAEAGADYAAYCLNANNDSQTWGPATGRPNLTQTTDCNGAPLGHTIASLTSDGLSQSTFSVGNVSYGTDNTIVISVSAQVNRASGAGTVGTTYAATVKRAVQGQSLTYGNAAFGYYTNPYNGASTASGGFFAILGSDGQYRAAGSNDYGQLGNGTTTNTLTPTIFKLPAGKTAAHAYTSFLSRGFDLFVITTDGQAYGAGLGDSGQLGNGQNTINNPNPTLFPLPAGENAQSVTIEESGVIVETESGNLYAAGACSYGQLGVGSCDNGSEQMVPKRIPLPAVDQSNPDTIPTGTVVSDSTSAFVIMKSGKVYGWGHNDQGQFGVSGQDEFDTPVQVGNFGNPGYGKAVSIAFDGASLWVVDSNGQAWGTGLNALGELGQPDTTSNYYSFQHIDIPSSAGPVLDVATDQYFAIFRTATQVWGTGLDKTGELGDGQTVFSSNAPVRFQLPNGITPRSIYVTSLGDEFNDVYDNTFVVATNGRVYGAGSNDFGQLGIGTSQHAVSIPQQMQVFGNRIKATSVESGYGTTLILTKDNRYFTVGNNEYGQLGDGTTNNRNTPATSIYLNPLQTYLF